MVEGGRPLFLVQNRLLREGENPYQNKSVRPIWRSVDLQPGRLPLAWPTAGDRRVSDN